MPFSRLVVIFFGTISWHANHHAVTTKITVQFFLDDYETPNWTCPLLLTVHLSIKEGLPDNKLCGIVLRNYCIRIRKLARSSVSRLFIGNAGQYTGRK